MHGTELIEFLWRFSNAPLSTELTEATQRVLLDTLGCALYGASQPWTRIVAEFASDRPGLATIAGLSGNFHLAAAALTNGTSAHGFELDDYLEGCFTHAGAVIVPAALATAEAVGANGRQMLVAIAAGYELFGRLGLAMGSANSDRGMHYTGQLGAVAAALTSGIVRQFSVMELRNAVGIAASMGAGVKAFTQGSGGMVKRLHAGRAAESGVIAAQLTSKGFTAPKDALDGAFGIIAALGGSDANPSRLTDGLGIRFMIGRNWTKLYPCCAVLHAACQAIEELSSENGLAADQVDRIVIGGSKRMVSQNGGRDISDVMSAQYSMPFAGAAALFGSASVPTSYDPTRMAEAAFRGAMEKVELVVDREVDQLYPDAFGARVKIHLRTGEVLERMISHPSGTAQAGVTDQAIAAKFRQLSSSLFDDDSIQQIIDITRTINSAPNVAHLSHALRRARLSPFDAAA